jgi:hypothetical protein
MKAKYLKLTGTVVELGLLMNFKSAKSPRFATCRLAKITLIIHSSRLSGNFETKAFP